MCCKCAELVFLAESLGIVLLTQAEGKKVVRELVEEEKV